MRSRALLLAALVLLLSTACDRARVEDKPGAASPVTPLIAEMCPDTTKMTVDSQKMCTQIGCTNDLRLLLPEELAKTPGSYRIAVKTRGEEASCEFTMPVTSCDQRPKCSNEEKLVAGVSGCALSAGEQKIGELSLRDLPPEVALTIERDGAVVLEKTLSPTYTSAQPNGEGCAPRCCQAEAQL